MHSPDQKIVHHFGVHNAREGSPIAINANAGDTLLFQATRDLFDQAFGPRHWQLEALWEAITPERIRSINENAEAILIGGGGLFLRDQAGANTTASGWQWNCPPELIASFSAPIIVFGVGYNRFRGHAEFDPVFTEHINALVQKSIFFGLRNNGSVRAIQGYLTERKERVSLQPCPTTLSWYLYKEFQRAYDPAGRNLVVNIAFDRRELRYPNEDNILSDVAHAVGALHAAGWNVTLANHKPQDEEFGKWLTREGIPFRAVNLSNTPPQEILAFYRDQDAVIGARGHAQMIPFGLRKPVVSIISHDKLQWFLDDITHPEWGADVNDADFEKRLAKAIEVVIMHGAKTVADVAEAQDRLWAITKANLGKIGAITGWSLSEEYK
jgi:hypothetical protein